MKRFKVDIIILLILLALCLGALLHHFPIRFSSDDAAGTAMMPQQLGQSGVLLILPDRNENARAYTDVDFSFAWYNLLSQYVGPFGIALASSISGPVQAQLIVVPQKTAESMTESQIQAITQSVQRGATLILEMPTPEWGALTAVKRNAKTSAAIKHLTDAPNSPLAGIWRDQLLNTPLDTQVLRIDTLDSETLPGDALLLELDGAIAHYRRPLGSGFVFTLAFNLGQALTSMQQGRPADSFEIETDEPPVAGDLVMNEKLRANKVPYADLLKLHVLMSAQYASPMPFLWPFADGRRSALLLVHETGGMGDEVFRMAEYEQAQDAQSTWLLTAGKHSKKSLESLKNARFDLGVSLVRPPTGRLYDTYGPSFFAPVAGERNMEDQKNAVMRRLGAGISTCKLAGSAWSYDYTLNFRKLAAAQCQIDLTYAPTQPEQFGYLFGTGFPFLPIERNGLPLPTYEFPSVLSDAAGFETLPAKIADELLSEAEQTYHQPIVVQMNADTMLTHPTYLIPEIWLGLIRAAKDQQVWIATAKAFMHHYTLRKQAHLTHAFHPQTKVLDVKAELPKANFMYTVALPRRTMHGAIHDLWLDRQAVDINVLKTTADGLLLLLPVTSGDHLVQVQYN